MTQKEICRLLQRDPEQGLRQVLHEYGNLMYAIALNILKSPQDAEDCVSESLVRLWKNYRKLRGQENLKNYLCSITRNGAIDMLRTRQKRMEQSLEDELNEFLSIPDSMAERLDSAVIREQLESLGEPTCSIFLRRYWYCETVDEIAAALHLSRSAVESRLHRGKIALKEKLTQGGF